MQPFNRVVTINSSCFCVKPYKGLSVRILIGDKTMGRIDVVLPDDLEKRLREAVYQRKGMKRGNLKSAINEAIILWIGAGGKVKNRKGENE